MPAKRESHDRWSTWCAECGTGGTSYRLDPEGPLNAHDSIALRDAHNKAFHDGRKMTNHRAEARYNVVCEECYPDKRALLEEATQSDAHDFVEMHNRTFH